jgi:cell division septation protein DedD
MQIHEITLKPVAEGVLKNIGNNLAARAIKAAASKTGISPDSITANSPETAAASAAAATVPRSKFLQQFQIIDNSPITVQWKNQQFQRKNGTGQWISFPAGKPVSQQMIDALDKVSPPTATTTPTSTPAPVAPASTAPPLSGQGATTPVATNSTIAKPAATTTTKPIVIKDKTGVNWIYTFPDRKWRGPDNEEVIDPVSIQKLNKAAEVQFQNRQMGQK